MQQSYQKAVDSLRDYERLYGKRIVKIFGAANHYILMNLGDGLAASKPFPVETNGKRVWNLSIMLAPKAGGPADVGSVFVDDKTLQVRHDPKSRQGQMMLAQ